MKRLLKAIWIGFVLLPSTMYSQSQSQSIVDFQNARKAEIEKLDKLAPSQEASIRKARSIALLKQQGVPVMENLRAIEDSFLAKHRSKEEIAKRAIAVCITALKGEGLEQNQLDKLVAKYGAEHYFSPKESEFIADPNPSQQDKINYCWRYEDYWVLLWALGYIDTLDFPKDICDVKKAVNILATRTTQQFIDDAKLRDLSEILDQADLIYRYDWAAVNARLKNQPAPAGMDKGVVMERHFTFNWLIGHLDRPWDLTETDT